MYRPDIKAVHLPGLTEDLTVKIALVEKILTVRELLEGGRYAIILLTNFRKDGKPRLFVCDMQLKDCTLIMPALYKMAADYQEPLEAVVRKDKKRLLPSDTMREQTSCFIAPIAFAEMLTGLANFKEDSAAA